MKNNLKVILFYAVFIALICIVVAFLFQGSSTKEIVKLEDYSQVLADFGNPPRGYERGRHF